MDKNFVKEQFEIAKKASHLSETVVMDVKTLEWLIEQVGKVERYEMMYENTGAILNRQNMRSRIEELEKENRMYRKWINELQVKNSELTHRIEHKIFD